MIKGIKKAITEGLAKEVGETLKQELERLYKVEAENKKMKDSISELLLDSKKMKECISTHENLQCFEVELNRRDDDLFKKEQQFDSKRLTSELLVEKEKSAFCKEVALGLVRNQEYNTNVFKTKTEPGSEQNNYIQRDKQESINTTENIS